MKITRLDAMTKILLIILVVAASYFIIFLISRPFFITRPSSMTDIMAQMMTGNIRTSLNLFSFIIALVIGVIISFYLFKQTDKDKDKEYNIIKKALSEAIG